MDLSTPHASIALTGSTRLFPVVGNPVAQVQAPRVFNELFAYGGVDARVVPLHLPPALVVDTCRALLESQSVGGLLVTVPYKATLYALCDEVDEQAELTGAVNAIRRAPDGRLHGAMLDGVGFLDGLRAAGHEPAGRRVLLLGAGGAGSAIAAVLAMAGAAAIDIHDPQPGRAAALAERITRAYKQCDVRARDGVVAAGHDIVVNATPLGMQPTDPLPIDPRTLDAATLVVDVIMKPARTALLEQAREHGCPTHPGQPMLDYQAPAYLRFFGLPQVAELAQTLLATRARHDTAS